MDSRNWSRIVPVLGTAALMQVAIATLCSPSAEAVPLASVKQVAQGVVNINTATKQQLMLLPRVGEAAAERIIAYRQKHPFRRIDELTRVRGIKMKSFRHLKDYLSTDKPTTLAKKVHPKAD